MIPECTWWAGAGHPPEGRPGARLFLGPAIHRAFQLSIAIILPEQELTS